MKAAQHMRCINGCSEPFAVTVGAHQELALSPFTICNTYGLLDRKHQKGTLENDACGWHASLLQHNRRTPKKVRDMKKDIGREE